MQYNFDWDPVKAKQNLQKHGVSFERAARIFIDPFAISIYDDELVKYRLRKLVKTQTMSIDNIFINGDLANLRDLIVQEDKKVYETGRI